MSPVVGNGTGSDAGGNTASHAVGNTTIALEAFQLDIPDTPGATSLAQITSSSAGNFQATEAALLAGTPPSSMKISVNTNSTKNIQWAVPEEMNEYVLGTRDLRWITLGHTTVSFANPANYNIVGYSGAQIDYDWGKHAFVYTATEVTPDGTFAAGSIVDHTNPFYWNQIKTYMGSKANGSFKDKYREYRVINSNVNDTRDELLQVWTWNNSYSTHYENQIGTGDPKQQAWSFGGTKSTAVPTTGTRKYNGRFVATAKTEGWKPGEGADVNPNALWMVQGRSEINADFANSKIRGTLSPETWSSYQGKLGMYTWFTPESGLAKPGNIAVPPSVGNGSAPDYSDIYSARIVVDGTITADPNATAPGGAKNTIAGTSTLTGNFYSGDNPMYGGIYGNAAEELTGVFSVKGTSKAPLGGSTGIVDPKNATLTINGSFNACVAGSPGCVP